MSLEQNVTQAFETRFGQAPAFVVRAPGRVNLIGEHTDYNDGFVFPMAIDRAAWIALRPRQDGRVLVHSLDFGEEKEFDLAALSHNGSNWIEYVKGVAWVLQEAGHTLTGWEGIMAGDVPIGSGLSSSAALELATARAFAAVSGFEWQPTPMARLAQRAENKWIGVSCGIMDQLISAEGLAGHALLIDCRSLELRPYPLPAGTAIVILDTATRRGLESSAYNERRSQCEAAAKHFGASVLRDVTDIEFEARGGELDPLTRRRARHVVSENARTLLAADAMREGNAEALGRLMNQSHTSLRDDFEVSCAELNAMVESALVTDGCLGARMTGAGFGGCAIALVRAEAAEKFMTQVAERYENATGLTPQLYLCQPTGGAELVRPRN